MAQERPWTGWESDGCWDFVTTNHLLGLSSTVILSTPPRIMAWYHLPTHAMDLTIKHTWRNIHAYRNPNMMVLTESLSFRFCWTKKCLEGFNMFEEENIYIIIVCYFSKTAETKLDHQTHHSIFGFSRSAHQAFKRGNPPKYLRRWKNNAWTDQKQLVSTPSHLDARSGHDRQNHHDIVNIVLVPVVVGWTQL